MKITTSDNYFHDYGCELGECGRQYCLMHRLLWRDCDTAVETMQGDRDVIGGTRMVYELADCPECTREHARKKIDRLMHERAA